MNINKYLNMLGRRAKDRVTGFEGVVASIHFDLYGCIQATLSPPIDGDGKKRDAGYFDVCRLDVTSEPVMERPNWEFGPVAEGKHGPAEKPAFEK